ncbi:cadherin-like beta sandwich domain-containing protein [Paenibacillus sp. GXUN7292]|uniref:cadherin-like beta sandwich domain-containing protein n=1 Tax=Paenibacillus sp. GXUN7292 TaxID=3422499 RepID=UPI003D7D22F5
MIRKLFGKKAKMLMAAALVLTMTISGLLLEPPRASAASMITIDSPSNGASVESGTVRISGTYAGLYDIKLFINGTRQVDAFTYDPTGSDSGTWHYDLDTSIYNGTIQLRARGLDTTTRYGIWSSDMQIHISNDEAAAPIVTIESPLEGMPLSGIVPIQVQVQSAAAINRVEVRVNGGQWQAAALDGQGYAWSWDTSGLSDQIVSIEARAFNENEVRGRSLTTYAQIGEGLYEDVIVNTQDRSMWIWEGASYNMLLNPGSRNVLLSMGKDTDTFDSEPVKVLYFAVGPFAGMDVMEDRPDLLRDFIAWAHEHGFEVQACIAGGTSPPYMGAYRAFHDVAIRHFEQVLNYNLSSDSNERFDGVNVDIEPYISPDFADESKFLQVEYLELIEKMIERRDASGLNLSFGPAIPRWYDSSDRAKDITFNGQTKWLSEHIQDMVDYISIMNYRDQADGSVGLIAQAQGEMDYANLIGKPNSVIIGVETLDIANSGDPETITFREEGRTYMEAELDKVYTAFANDPAFGGIAMHHYDSIRWLPSHWGPDGVLWLPPEDHEPPTAVSSNPSAQAVDYQTITLSYGRAYDNTEVENYVIYRSTEAGFTASAEHAVGTSRTLTYKDTGLLPATTYYYKVAAVDLSGNIGPVSEQTAATTGNTSLKPMIVSSMKVERAGTASSAAIRISEYLTGMPIEANVEGRFTYAGGRYVSGQTDGGQVSFTSENIPDQYLIGFMPRRVVASGYYWAQAYDTPKAANVYPRVRLQSLAVSGGQLSEVFAPDKAHYKVLIENQAASIQVTPTAEEAGTAILVNGVPVASGTASQPIPLGDEDTIIVVQTIAPNAAMDSYTITVQRSAPPVDNVFVAVEDAHVHQNNPSTNYGASEYLNVMDILNADGGGDQLAYLKFDLADYTLPVEKAELFVYATETVSKKVKIDVIGYPDSSWKESTIVFNNRPLQNPQALGTFEVQEAGWYSIDVTPFVQSRMGAGGDQKATIRFIINDIPNSSGTLVQFHSREHALNQPYLLINPSSDATLANLTLSSGSLEPAFDPGQLEYSAVVSGESITLTPAVSESHAVVTVNGETVTSGMPSQEIPLVVGENPPIAIEVTAQDGSKTMYQVIVTSVLSSNADLDSLVLRGAQLQQPFDANVTQYTGTAASSAQSVQVEAFASDLQAKVYVNDQLTADGLSDAITLNYGKNTITVRVEAQDGTEKTYTVDVTRQSVWYGDSGGSSGGTSTSFMEIDVSEQQIIAKPRTELIKAADGSMIGKVQIVGDAVSKALEKAKAAAQENADLQSMIISIGKDDEEQAAGWELSIEPQALTKLQSAGLDLELLGPGWSLTMPQQAMAGLAQHDELLTIRIMQLTDTASQKAIAERLSASPLVLSETNGRKPLWHSAPLLVETNFSGEQLVLALLSSTDNESLQYEQIEAGLGVYIEHSDGDVSFQRGKIVNGPSGKPAGVQITVDKFSTFTVVALPQKLGAYINGYTDGTFRPDHSITRAELATLLDRLTTDTSVSANKQTADLAAAAGKQTADTSSSSGNQTGEHGANLWRDVQQHWAKNSIEHWTANGVFNGYPNQTFMPGRAVTRAELAAIVTRWKNVSLVNASAAGLFTDTDGHWAQDAIAAGHAEGWWNGYSDHSFRPDQAVTRAEAIAVLNRVTERIPYDVPGKLPWKDVELDHPFAGDIYIAASSDEK